MTGLRVNARAFLGTWLLWLFLLSPFAHAARMNIPDAPTNDGNGAALVSALVARPGGGVIAGGSFTQVGARTGTAAWLSPSTGEGGPGLSIFHRKCERRGGRRCGGVVPWGQHSFGQ
jgi:hypothetical protein